MPDPYRYGDELMSEISNSLANQKPNEAHVETCGAGYSEYAMCDSPEACADLRNAPVAEPEPCRYTQPDGTRCSRPGEPKHGMCGPHYWARDDEWRAPVVEPNPVCGARVDYHGGTCGRRVGHDEPCAPVVEPEAACEGCPDPGLPCAGCPVVEPEPRCVRGLPAGNCCERYDTCEPVEPERMPCGHSRAAIVSSGEGTSYCGECAEVCSPDDYETGPEPTCAAAYQHGRADERDGYSGEHSPSAVEAGNDGERATHATGSDAVGLSPSSRCACGATITGTRCDASGMTAAVCQKVPLLDSTTNRTAEALEPANQVLGAILSRWRRSLDEDTLWLPDIDCLSDDLSWGSDIVDDYASDLVHDGFVALTPDGTYVPTAMGAKHHAAL